MFSNTIRGLLSGLAAGIFLGFFMQLTAYPVPGGGSIQVMMLVAQIVHWDTPVAGWIWHLANSAFIGAIYGTALGTHVHTYRVALFWGALYGVLWWLGGNMVLMSLFLGWEPFSFIHGVSQKAGMITLVGHLIFGLLLATCYTWLSEPRQFRLSALRLRRQNGN